MSKKKHVEAEEEVWTTRDGRKIAVGDMEPQHLRNTLRMILRKRRLAQQRLKRIQLDLDIDFDGQAELSSSAQRDLANPNCYFPLLEGGVYGSAELAKKYGK